LKPRYGEKSLADEPKGRFNLVVSKAGREGSLAINQDADLYVAKLEAGNEASHELKPARHAWVHVAEGEVKLNGDTLKAGDAVALSDESQVQLVAAKPSQVLLFDLN
jgi:redox-sensitive bicupin YhaK (pirin superfamily)